ncbi:MAG: glycosyltransferase family 4 protein [bacterium]
MNLTVAMIGEFPVGPDLIHGGCESVMLYLSQGLAAIPGVAVEAVTIDRWNLGARQETYGKLRTNYLTRSKMPLRAHVWDDIRTVTNFLRRLQPDIVHAHVASMYAEAAHRAGLPWVLTLHGVCHLEAELLEGWVDRIYRKRLILRAEQNNIRRASNIIAINPFIEDSYRGQLPESIFHIENPVAHRYFEIDAINEPNRLLYVGRLIPLKDVHTLLRAFRLIRERIPGAQLRLAGNAGEVKFQAYADGLQQFVQEAGLQDSVVFLGHLSEADLLEEYARAAVITQSTLLETAPMAVAQAMAAATAVVATDAGGTRYLVKEGSTGHIVPLSDHQRFAAVLCELLERDSRALEFGHNARQLALRRFTPDVVARATLTAYETILARKRQ